MKSQGKTPEEAGIDISEFDNAPNKKALVTFLYIKDLFETNDTFDLSKISGRMNLYCKLLVHHLGVESINELLSYADTKAAENEVFKALCCQNLILPQSIGEMNLRIKHMWGALTPVFTAAMECGKRQTAMLWSELETTFDGKGFNTFFNISPSRLYDHRKTPNQQVAVEFFTACDLLSQRFYHRLGKVPSNFYCLNKSAPGMTYKLTKKAETTSETVAVENMGAQTKYVNSYIKDIVDEFGKMENLASVCYVPTELEAQTLVFEKDVLKQNWNMRRLFYEVLCELTKQKGNTDMTLILAEYKKEVNAIVKGWRDREEPYSNLWINQKDIKDGNRTDLSKMENNIKVYLSEKKKKEGTAHASRSVKWYYQDESKWCQLYKQTKALPFPEPFDLDKVTDTDTREFVYGVYLVMHSAGGKTAKTAKRPLSTWRPYNLQVLACLIAQAVYNMETCKELSLLLLNNGKKEINSYMELPREYVHEVAPNEDPIQLVRYFEILI